MRSGGWGLQDGISVLIRGRDARAFLSLPRAGTLISDFPDSGTMRNTRLTTQAMKFCHGSSS